MGFKKFIFLNIKIKLKIFSKNIKNIFKKILKIFFKKYSIFKNYLIYFFDFFFVEKCLKPQGFFLIFYELFYEWKLKKYF